MFCFEFVRTPPWGKPGPGGKLWRHPKEIGIDFLKAMVVYEF